MKLLITGGCGFLGANLAQAALAGGDDLIILDNLSRLGSRDNLKWLQTLGRFKFLEADIRSADAVMATVSDIKPDAIFHLAGQVAMTTSLADPRRDFETNVIGAINVLEAVRSKASEAKIIYSSTNKVYGDFSDVAFRETETRYIAVGHENGFTEKTPLNFQSPYGCSKGAADQYMLDYHRIFGLKTTVFRHSSIFGDRQFSTYDQGWIGWFASQAIAVAQKKSGDNPVAVSGNGKQVRDVLFACDIVNCYFAALASSDEKMAGEAFNIGGGMPNSLSILELFSLLEKIVGTQLPMACGPWRVSDQKVFVADTTKARRLFGWKPRMSAEEGVRRMVDWIKTIER